jgi:hypothetical protein
MSHIRPLPTLRLAASITALLAAGPLASAQVSTGGTMQIGAGSHTSAKSQQTVVGLVNAQVGGGPDVQQPAGLSRPLAPPPPVPATPTVTVSSAASPTAASPAPAAKPVINNEPLIGEEKALWNSNWRQVANKFGVFNNQFYFSPNWDPRYPSSAHLLPDTWITNNTKVTKQAVGSFIKPTTFVPPREEAIAATATLPRVATGQYGHIQSAMVLEVRGPQEMIVNDIQMVDATSLEALKKVDEAKAETLIKAAQAEVQRQQEQQRQQQMQQNSGSGTSTTSTRRQQQTIKPAVDATELRQQITEKYKERERISKQQKTDARVAVRVLGFSTAGLTPGSRWTSRGGMGPQLVLVADPDAVVTPAPTTSARPMGGFSISTAPKAKTLLAVNGELFKGLTEDQFHALLAKAQMTDAQFVADLKAILKTGAKDGQVQMAQKVEEGRIAAAQAEQQRLAEEAKAKAAEAAAAKQAARAGGATGGSTNPGSAASSDWLKQKYGNKTNPAAAATGDKPATTDKPAAPAPAASKSSDWFKNKYSKKNPAADAAKDDAK